MMWNIYQNINNMFIYVCVYQDTLTVLSREVSAHASGIPSLIHFMSERIAFAASQPKNSNNTNTNMNTMFMMKHTPHDGVSSKVSSELLPLTFNHASQSHGVGGGGDPLMVGEGTPTGGILARELTVKEIESVLESSCAAYKSNDEYEPLKVCALSV
jgi:hypothetical protein